MDILIQWIPEAVLQAIGQAMMHSLWQGAGFALLLAACLWILKDRSANTRYWAGMATLFLFAATVAGTGVYAYANYASGASALAVPAAPEPMLVISLNGSAVESVPSWQLPFIEFQSYFQLHAPLFVGIWAMGALLFSLRLLGSYLFAQRLRVYRIQPVQGEWQELLDRLAQRIGLDRSVKLLESALAESPMTIGYWKPVVLIPAGMLTGMPVDQVEAILAHELAHIRRYDYVLNILQSAIETVLFYHPATWWISGLIRDEREHACDDLALEACGNELAFARALTNLEEGNFRTPYLAMAMARNNQGALLQRIKRILGEPSKQFHLPEHLVVASLILLAVCSLAFRSPAWEKDFNGTPEVAELAFGEEAPLMSQASSWSYAVSDTTKKKGKKKKKKLKPNKPSKAPKDGEKHIVIVEERVVGNGEGGEKMEYVIERKEGGDQQMFFIKTDGEEIEIEEVPKSDGKSWVFITEEQLHSDSGMVVVKGDTLRSKRIRVIRTDVDTDLEFDFDTDVEFAPVNIDIDSIVQAATALDNFKWVVKLDSPMVVHIPDSLTAEEKARLKAEMARVHKEMKVLEKEMVLKELELSKEHEKEMIIEIKKEFKERAREMAEREKEMAERHRELSERAMERVEREVERAGERKVIIEERRIAREEERAEHNKFWTGFRSELAKDGIIKKDETPIQIFLNDEVLRVNGKEASKEQHGKYVKMVKEHFKLKKGTMNWSISDEQMQIMIHLK